MIILYMCIYINYALKTRKRSLVEMRRATRAGCATPLLRQDESSSSPRAGDNVLGRRILSLAPSRRAAWSALALACRLPIIPDSCRFSSEYNARAPRRGAERDIAYACSRHACHACTRMWGHEGEEAPVREIRACPWPRASGRSLKYSELYSQQPFVHPGFRFLIGESGKHSEIITI